MPVVDNDEAIGNPGQDKEFCISTERAWIFCLDRSRIVKGGGLALKKGQRPVNNCRRIRPSNQSCYMHERGSHGNQVAQHKQKEKELR